MRHRFAENRTRIALILLAIPAGFEPATHGVETNFAHIFFSFHVKMLNGHATHFGVSFGDLTAKKNCKIEPL